MARTYYVKRAQQRYATKPVLDENGQPKRTPRMRRGVQMKTKHGRPVFMSITERDLTRPLPMPKCSKCGTTIEVGQPYKYTEAYNRTIIRCGTCPAPQVWEYSSSLSARLAQITYDAGNAIDAADDLTSARDDFASAVRELAEEKEASASNIEDGFGHETEQSNELRDIAEQLNSWADDIESVDLDLEPEEQDCDECAGTGYAEGGPEQGDPDVPCDACDGTGQVTPEEPSEDQLEAARDALREQVDACPL